LARTNNPVRSINTQSTPENVKSVSLKPLLEHFYLEDRRIAIMHIASSANVQYYIKLTEDIALQNHQKRKHLCVLFLRDVKLLDVGLM